MEVTATISYMETKAMIILMVEVVVTFFMEERMRIA